MHRQTVVRMSRLSTSFAPGGGLRWSAAMWSYDAGPVAGDRPTEGMLYLDDLLERASGRPSVPRRSAPDTAAAASPSPSYEVYLDDQLVHAGTDTTSAAAGGRRVPIIVDAPAVVAREE
jgi:hypothetical protein